MTRRTLIWVPIFLALAAVLLWAGWQRSGNGPGGGGRNLGEVQKAFAAIDRHYYRTPDAQTLRRRAVRAMVESLDEYSRYVPPDKAEKLKQRIAGQDSGLGLEIGPTAMASGVVVVRVAPGSPADDAGLLAGDFLIAVGGGSVKDMKPDPLGKLRVERVRELLDLKPGASVELTVRSRRKNNADRTVALTAGTWPIETVRGFRRDWRDDVSKWHWRVPTDRRESPETRPAKPEPVIAYVRIVEFCPRTAQRLREILNTRDRLDALVVDLRGNPGGMLSDAAAAADLFLDDGVIVAVAGRGPQIEVHRAHDDTPWGELPLTVLVDSGTASAAEVFAGAMQSNSRALLIGRPTRGKHCIQSMIDLGELGMLNLTTSEFFFSPVEPVTTRPAGPRHAGPTDPAAASSTPTDLNRPIVPDEPVAMTDEQRQRIAELQDTLGTPLPPKNHPAWQMRISPGQKRGETIQDLLQIDADLARALELLGDPRAYRKRLEELGKTRRTVATQPAKRETGPPRGASR